MNAEPFVIEIARGGFIESVHVVDVAVVDHAGRLIASAGDAERPAAFRSSAKPLQARVSMECGWRPAEERHIAIACASHNGEPEHIDVVRALLASAGLSEEALACPADLPATRAALLRAPEPRRITHNCSGKHAGMLAACVAAGWPVEGYRDPDHPLQQRVRAMMRALLGVEERLLVDGCGAPTFVAPLVAFARAFRAIDDGGPETVAMRAHPFLVAGTDRFDTDLMRAAPHIVAKVGAEGLACASGADVGIAVKVRDGDAGTRARGPVMVAVLSALGILDGDQRGSLVAHERPAVLGGGAPVGSAVARGALTNC